MNKFLNKMEAKYGKYAITNLMKYITILYIFGTVICLIGDYTGSYFFNKYLALDFNAIFHGQVWRLFTFALMPPRTSSGEFDLIWIAIELYMYYLIGNAIERSIGAFKFNCYYLSGYILNVLACLVIFLVFRTNGIVGVYYINRSLLFTFAMLFPNLQFLLFFIIPVKAKWIAILDGVIIGIDLIKYTWVMVYLFKQGNVASAIGILTFIVSIVVSLLNFVAFYFVFRESRGRSFKQVRRKKNFENKTREKVKVNSNGQQYRHKCCICNRTELDDENLQFRYCSKCKGNFEYCSDHLFTHEHKK